jgi:hypothetical protein
MHHSITVHDALMREIANSAPLVGDDAADADHFVTAGERLKIAMARQ